MLAGGAGVQRWWAVRRAQTLLFLFSGSSRSWRWHTQCRNSWKQKCDGFCKGWVMVGAPGGARVALSGWRGSARPRQDRRHTDESVSVPGPFRPSCLTSSQELQQSSGQLCCNAAWCLCELAAMGQEAAIASLAPRTAGLCLSPQPPGSREDTSNSCWADLQMHPVLRRR